MHRHPFIRILTRSFASSATAPLKRTPLYDLHKLYGAKMVPFAGYEMPVLYADLGLTESHLWTRAKSSIFDVSHMVQFKIKGESATEFLESITPSGIHELQPGQGTLSVLLNEQGGIIDDTIITKHSNTEFYIVTNAACREKDLTHIQQKLQAWGKPLSMELLDDHGLIALQGPSSMSILQQHTDQPLSDLKFGRSAYLPIQGVTCHVARGGYTGEDGFEISIPVSSISQITEGILNTDANEVKLAGLGSRDSLRLEAGMCLYGHDLSDEINPIEASLAWLIPKRRRADGGFPGHSQILETLKRGPAKRRVGLIVSGAPAREGATVLLDGQQVGSVTSGCPSPSLSKNIAMAYIDASLKIGTPVDVVVRKRVQSGVITKMPFVETKYYK